MKKDYNTIQDEKLKYAYTCKMNDLWYDICNDYTMSVMTGNPAFDKKYKALFEIYKTRGGKRTEQQIHLTI